MRNVELTKQRILAAATEEFSRYGFAGARVDRIAANAEANKALIYSYFGSKEKLFTAVFYANIGIIAQDVPLDARDLPGYLEQRIDWSMSHSELPRIGMWGDLEVPGYRDIPEMQQGRRIKEERIAQAQRDGLVSDRFTANELLHLIDALAYPAITLDPSRAVEVEAYKQAAVRALRLLLEEP